MRTEGFLGLAFALATAVACAFAVYTLLARTVGSPRIFVDELRYWEAAGSLASGDGLKIRGESYTYGPVYPTLLAGVLRLFPDRESAYELAKAMNAFLFALAVIPVYLLARRLLAPGASLGVAALSVAIPSSMYVSVVMTESVAYLATAWAMYAMVVAFESPTAVRQGTAIVAILLAYLVRPQFAGLYVAYLAGLGLVLGLAPRRGRWREELRRLWPSALSVGVALTTFLLVPLLRGESPRKALGGYEEVWRSYDSTAIGKWLVYHLANMELYVAIVPLAVAPVVLTSLLRSARTGSRRHAAFVALFLSVNAALLSVAAVADSAEASAGRLHDRYTFYLVPLWLLLLFIWLAEGARRPIVPAIFGSGLALLLPMTLPFSTYAADDGAQRFAGVASTLWAGINRGVSEVENVSGRSVLMSVTLALVLAAFILPRKLVLLFPITVLVVFAVTGILSWHVAARAADERGAFLVKSERRWLDERVPSRGSVTTLFVNGDCVPPPGLETLYQTEFFNSSSARAANVGGPPDQLPSQQLHVSPGGRLLRVSGHPVRGDYVVTQLGVRLVGRRVGATTNAKLVLWDVGGPLRAQTARSTDELRGDVCRAAAGQ